MEGMEVLAGRGEFLRKYENLVTPPVGLVNLAVHVFADGRVDQSTTTYDIRLNRLRNAGNNLLATEYSQKGNILFNIHFLFLKFHVFTE